jgi:DNA polymerase elongation subunit (family B)
VSPDRRQALRTADLSADFDIIPELGRVNSGSTGGKGDKWGYTQTSGIKVTGRHMLNIWRLMRGELTLNQYSFDNVVFHLLRRRTPRFAHAVITQWYSSGVPALMKRALAYWIDRTEIDLEVIETSEVVFRTAEFARIYGVDFFSVISRGSQFKVESVMFRIAKPESFILLSPNQQQVGEQNAAEALPLVMEPQSAFYKGPLLVLDFTSLYPSLMIAYNLCYSTCLGRVSKFRDSWKLGFTDYVPPRGLLSLLEKDCFGELKRGGIRRRRLSRACSLAQWHALRQAAHPAKPARQDARRDSRDARHGQGLGEGHEGREGLQAPAECAPALAQAARQRHVRLYQRDLLGTDAVRRGGRRDRAVRA